MAPTDGWADHPLARALTAEAPRFSFFQAVHLVQAAFPDAVRVGMQGPPEKELLRFRADLSLGFPSADLVSIRVTDGPVAGRPRFEVTTTFLGVVGSASPLPTFYTEDVMGQDPDESLVLGFLDLFHHRLISLFYRVWEKYRYAIQFRAGGTDTLSKRLMAMTGLGPDLMPPRPKIPPVRLLAYTGLLCQLPRSAAALRAIIADYFDGVPVAIEQAVGRWLEIPAPQRVRLGAENCTLGRDASPGDRVFDRGATFRIVLGPLGLTEFMSFLPVGASAARLQELVDLVNGDGLDYEVELRLRRDESPELRLSSDAARLGWSTWLGTRDGSEGVVRFLLKGRVYGQR